MKTIEALPGNDQKSGGKKLIFENARRGSSFEIPDFEIPDFFDASGDNTRTQEKDLYIKVENSAVPDLGVFISIASSYEPILASLEVNGVCGEAGKRTRVFSFKDSLFRDVPPSATDGIVHTYWHSRHRKVEPEYRTKGLAEFGLKLREAVIKKIADKYPELKAEYMEVVTDIPAVGKLLIDQNWLKSHGLAAFLNETGLDMGYVPNPESEHLVGRLLETDSTPMDEIRVAEDPPVRLIKKIE